MALTNCSRWGLTESPDQAPKTASLMHGSSGYAFVVIGMKDGDPNFKLEDYGLCFEEDPTG